MIVIATGINIVVPTHVGVFLIPFHTAAPTVGCPHARGGVPHRQSGSIEHLALSPRTWGCSSHWTISTWRGRVVPTHVGVFLTMAAAYTARSSLSPRTWGCSCPSLSACRKIEVVPTHVGVFLARAGPFPRGTCCPHARGGVPWRRICFPTAKKLSPRTWGCSGLGDGDHSQPGVVPTHVGMIWKCAKSRSHLLFKIRCIAPHVLVTG